MQPSSGAMTNWPRSTHGWARSPRARRRSCSRESPGSARPSCGRRASVMLPTPACRCLHTAVSEAEAGLGFAGLSDLIEPVIDELVGGLAPPRRAALEIALLRADAGDVPPDSRAIGLAVRDALVLLTQSRPVVLALDDIQWLDRSSADVLATALRRLLREPVLLLATLRLAPDLTPTLDLRRAFDDERLRLATLEPLELGQLSPAAERKARARAGPAGATRAPAHLRRQSVLRAGARP